jgi:hypothetical protein
MRGRAGAPKLIRLLPTPPVSSPSPAPAKRSSSARAFQPRELQDLVVELSIANPKACAAAAERVRLFGATVQKLRSARAPDLVLTDSLAPRRQGARPRVLRVDEVPWLFWSQARFASLVQPSPPAVVVADAAAKCRPAFKPFPEPTQLFFGAVPREYTTTPFARVPEHPGEMQPCPYRPDTLNFNASPADGGYCELCLRAFADAQEHRASKEHQQRAGARGAFRALDAAMRRLCAMERL